MLPFHGNIANADSEEVYNEQVRRQADEFTEPDDSAFFKNKTFDKWIEPSVDFKEKVNRNGVQKRGSLMDSQWTKTRSSNGLPMDILSGLSTQMSIGSPEFGT